MNIENIMKILEKDFYKKGKTTLNRMREKPDAFKVLIACLLSLRTQDKNTEIASSRLFAVVDTSNEIVKLSIPRLEKLIFSSGHYRKKAWTVKHVSQVLIDEFDSEVPDDKEKLLSIKGIGPKTANIVLAFAFGRAVIPVDVHVHVISNRLGFVKTKMPEQTEVELMNVVPKRFWKELNGIFVLFGKEICVTVSPKCSICPVRKYCPRIGVVRSR
jgi:endonuclease-3